MTGYPVVNGSDITLPQMNSVAANILAEERLRKEKEEGIDEHFWQVHYNNLEDFHPRKRTFFRIALEHIPFVNVDYPTPKETAADYFARMVNDGTILENGQREYIVKGGVVLELALIGNPDIHHYQYLKTFFDPEKDAILADDPDLHKVEGLVPVRRHLYEFALVGCRLKSQYTGIEGKVLEHKPDHISLRPQ
ncbi:MAG: hypothetical protein AABX51_01735 [Nanoarchaeota archaeon]